MSIEKALAILGLTKVPPTHDEITVIYKSLAKKCHPDKGGSEKAFQELQNATEVVRQALDVVLNTKAEVEDKDSELKKRRAILREEMLKRRAVEDRRRNIQATWGIGIILSILLVVIIGFLVKPHLNEWMVEKDRTERMAEVVFTDHSKVYEISWDYNGTKITKSVRGRLIDGKWLVGEAGMPILKGAKFVVAFNRVNPDYFVVKDEYIHPNTAEVYFAIMKHPIAALLDVPDGDKSVVCAFWNTLDQFGVDGLAHILFSEMPLRKNWSHNRRTFNSLNESEQFQNLIRSCTSPLDSVE